MKHWRTVLAALLIAAGCGLMVKFGQAAGGASGPLDQPRYDYAGFYAQLENYLHRFHDPAFLYDPHDLRGHFSYQPGRSYDLYGSCDMVYLLFTIGELEERTTEAGRREWAALIQGFQDPETGWFDKGNVTLHFREHATAYATGALKLLGSRPLHPFRWAERIIESEEAMDRWLSGIWWDVVWVGSHQGGGVAASLLMTDSAPEEWFGWFFAWLDREVNPETGLWQRAFYNRVYKKPMKNDLGGAAHFWWIYEAKGRPIPYPERVIDSVLSLQRDNGLWEKYKTKPTYPTCINCDAINGINLAYNQLLAGGQDYRRRDIEAAYLRFYEACDRILNQPDALEKLYTNAHDLPGGLIGVAEAERFMQVHGGGALLETRRPWRSVLEVISWL